jgi:hypothetical protein
MGPNPKGPSSSTPSSMQRKKYQERKNSTEKKKVHFSDHDDVQHFEKDFESGSPKLLEIFSNLFFWSEKYDKQLNAYWDKLPTYLGSLVASIAIFILGITARGIWSRQIKVYPQSKIFVSMGYDS